MDRIVRNLEANKTLNDALPALIEIFTKFYGEDCREDITNKFNNMILVGYYDETTLNVSIMKLQKEVTAKFVKEIFDKFGIEYNEENVKKYTNNTTLVYGRILPIIQCYEYINMVKKGKDTLLREEQQRRYDVFKSYISDLEYNDFINGKITDLQASMLPVYIKTRINSWTSEYNIDSTLTIAKNNIMKQLSELYPLANESNVDELIMAGDLDNLFEIGKEFKEAILKYEAYSREHIDKYIELNDKIRDLKRSIDRKYLVEYLLELKEYLNQDDQEKLEELVVKDDFHGLMFEELGIVLGCSLGGVKSIDYFDDKSEADLNNPNGGMYRKATIKENRVKYFKYRGIDLGDNYDDYVNNPKCLEVWPSNEMISRIQERSAYYQNQANIEFYSSFDIYKETLEKVITLKLLDKESILEPASFSRKQTCVYTNLKETFGEYKLYPVVCIFASGSDYDDKNLIHELNHLFELSLLNVSNNGYKCICGWDIIDGAMNQEKVELSNTVTEDKEKRLYELFNEIINELIAQKITKMMHESGVYILCDEDGYKDRGGTSYENTVFLVKDFFDEYLSDIIASRRNNNIEIIWDKVGKDNFDKLNELFYEFNENFSEFVYYRLVDDLRSNVDSELVRKYNSLKERRDEILSSMREYSKSNHATL